MKQEYLFSENIFDVLGQIFNDNEEANEPVNAVHLLIYLLRVLCTNITQLH